MAGGVPPTPGACVDAWRTQVGARHDHACCLWHLATAHDNFKKNKKMLAHFH